MGNQLMVQVLRGGQAIASHVFDSDSLKTIKIGRLPSAQLELDDPKVSRIHAVIELDGAQASLIDMGSTVGTAVNGAKIHKVKLKHGDRILLGDTELAVSLGAALAWVPVQPTPAASSVSVRAAVPAPVVSPRIDPGIAAPAPVRRIGQERLRDAAVENRPHPALAPEDAVRADNRVLEMRYYWGEVLLNVFHFVKPRHITIGENRDCTVFLTSEGLPVEAFPLIRFFDDEYVLTFTEQMEGEVELAGVVHKLEALRGSAMAQCDQALPASVAVRLATDARAVLHWGGATFALRFVAPPQMLPRAMFKNVDLGYLNMLVMLCVLHAAIAVTFEVYPYDTEELRPDIFTDPSRITGIILEPPKKDTTIQMRLKEMQQALAEKQIKKEEPKKVEKVPEQKTKLVVNVKAPVVKPQKTLEQKGQEVAKKFSGLFVGDGGGSPSLLGGNGGGTIAGTLANVIGTAGRGSSTAGMAGLNIRGGPLLGGGVGTSRGPAGIGTVGRMGGNLNFGRDVNLGRAPDLDVISMGSGHRGDALPREVILKVIRDNANQIRYCYEKELQKDQSLEGRVKIKWVIGATGEVVRAQVQLNETTLKNDAVEACMMEKIKGWRFPAPVGGGLVDVVYPWVFKAS